MAHSLEVRIIDRSTCVYRQWCLWLGNSCSFPADSGSFPYGF